MRLSIFDRRQLALDPVLLGGARGGGMTRRGGGFFGWVVFQQPTPYLRLYAGLFNLPIVALGVNRSSTRQHQRHRALFALRGLPANVLRTPLSPDIESGQRYEHDNGEKERRH